MKKLRFRRHESFSIRDGWIEKGLNSIKEHGSSTFHKEKGIKILGLGSNMVKSLKYWMIASNILVSTNKVQLSEFGEALLKYDKYMEDAFSWCLFQYYLSTNKEEAPIHYYITNTISNQKIYKETIIEDLKQYLDLNHVKYSEKSLLEDVHMYFRLYVTSDEANPEDNSISPLSKLGLLEPGMEEGEYIKSSIAVDKLSDLIVYFILQKLYKNSFHLESVFEDERTPIKIYNLDKSMLLQYLTILKNKGYITMNKTAGLNIVYFHKEFSIDELFAEYFGGMKYEL